MFLDLPTDILLDIARHLHKDGDTNSLCQTNRQLHDIFDDYLYRPSTHNQYGLAVFLATEQGNEPAVRKFLDLGVPVNILFPSLPEDRDTMYLTCMEADEPQHGTTPLHLAIWHDHENLVNLFLEAGADARIRTVTGWSTLCLALEKRNENIAQIMSQHIPDFRDHLAIQWAQITPLQKAASRGLLRSVRLFLDHGADVNARDSEGNTSLHHALATEWWQLGFEGLLDLDVAHRSAEEVLQVVIELIKAGANAFLGGYHSITPIDMAREYHKDERLIELLDIVKPSSED